MKIVDCEKYRQENPTLELDNDGYVEVIMQYNSIRELIELTGIGYISLCEYKDFTSEERFRILKEKCKNIKLTKGVFEYLYESGKLKELIELVPNADIQIEVSHNTDDLQTAHTLNAFVDTSSMMEEKGKNLFLISETRSSKQALYELKDVIFANEKIDSWANEINLAQVNGKSLSELEKFLYAYMIVKDRAYKESDDIRMLSRNIISILNTDYCVCMGFANLLKELCSRIGISCIDKGVIVGEHHAINGVIINDEKYGIENALYYSDPTYDCLTS